MTEFPTIVRRFASSVLALSLLALQGACGKQDIPPVVQGGATPSARPATDVLPPENAPPMPSAVDTIKPLDQYVTLDIHEPERDFAYLYAALGGRFPGGEQEMLSILSPRYFSEHDAFRKKELEATELPRVKAQIERHKAMRDIAFEINTVSLAAYDFTRNGFPLVSSAPCLNAKYKTGSGLFLKILGTQHRCFMPIANASSLEVAKRVEALRAANQLRAKVFMYARVEAAVEGQLELTPVAIKIQVSDYNASLSGKVGETVSPPVIADLIAR